MQSASLPLQAPPQGGGPGGTADLQGVPLTKTERNRQIGELWKDGLTQTEIGNLFGLNQNRISQILKILGISETDKINISQILRERFTTDRTREIADALGVSQRTVSSYVQDIELRQKAEEQADIYRLSALGWTHQEIGDITGYARSTITEKMSDLPNLVKLTKSLLDRGEPVSDVAEKLKIDLTLAWALALGDMDDISRLEKLSENNDGLNCNPRPYDVWNFAECCDLMGYEYKGRIPGQIALQLLYFFTEQGDLIVDPMAGSGTMIDACLLMKRRCLAFDNNPDSYQKRVDIRDGEALKTIQSLKRQPDLIFLDPPYFKKLEDEYSSDSRLKSTRNPGGSLREKESIWF